tara:strand:- start:578 stop:793 length:216 start_codon:yes stop_codon:yes gene_type:complete
MNQKPLSEALHEIQEIDQANNVVATYIKSQTSEKEERIDVVVSFALINSSAILKFGVIIGADLGVDSQECE